MKDSPTIKLIDGHHFICKFKVGCPSIACTLRTMGGKAVCVIKMYIQDERAYFYYLQRSMLLFKTCIWSISNSPIVEMDALINDIKPVQISKHHQSSLDISRSQNLDKRICCPYYCKRLILGARFVAKVS